MSGLYDIKRITDGYHDANVSFNNPAGLLANEHDRTGWRRCGGGR
jgi:esterase/lipase superfamily enzyme